MFLSRVLITSEDGDDGEFHVLVEEINDDYLVIRFDENTSQRLYYNRAKAETYYL